MAETCPKCHAEVSWAGEVCTGCGAYLGPPNVREVNAERDDLKLLFDRAVEGCRSRGAERVVLDFADAVEQHSQAVINVWPQFLAQFLNDGRDLYTSYALQTAAETRAAAAMLDDKARRGTEGTLFGDYGPQIRYAALSLDGTGLISYGSCSVALRYDLCRNKATLLEENSYHFVRRHRLLPGDKIPAGKRAVWNDRQCLATVKVAGRLNTHSRPNRYPKLLLNGTGDRGTDEFIEVHVYGPFAHQAVTSAVIPDPKKSGTKPEEIQVLSTVKDLLDQRKIPCKLV